MTQRKQIVPVGVRDDFRLLRGVVEHEDNLINHRFTWLIVAEAFLLAACVSDDTYPMPVVIAGLASTALTYASLMAAVRALEDLGKQVGNTFEGNYPHLMSTTRRHWLGLVGPLGVPVVFLGIWLWALLWGPR